jgi:hypothetical protein
MTLSRYAKEPSHSVPPSATLVSLWDRRETCCDYA